MEQAVTNNPVIDRYMDRFASSLSAFECNEQDEIVGDLRGHIAEAEAEGRPLDAVLQAMGPADTLARAYAVELALNPRHKRPLNQTVGAAIGTIALVTAGSLVSLVVVAWLGALGLSLTLSGIVMFAVGLLEIAGVHLPHVQLAGFSPVTPVGAGVLSFAIGIGSLWLLSLYVRFLAKAVRVVLPRRR
jgi:uncharacterized membrane protein